ncbi:MAG: hypothetical protein H0X29_04360 [Parachlamydiaceae bacterium]|nr:hypothetical protein [Parachlamydiaceae bacterium]
MFTNSVQMGNWNSGVFKCHETETPLEKNSTEINLNEIAKKTFSSLALTLTNTCLSATVLLSKITGITVIFPLAIGHLTKCLHKWNMKLSEHAFTPFRFWAQTLAVENQAIIETKKVINIVEGKVFFNPENYKKQSMFLIKVVFAPISLGLSIAAVPICIAAKPFWLAFFVPGIITDGIATGYTGVNSEISKLTYKPLQSLASGIHKVQREWFQAMMENFNNAR